MRAIEGGYSMCWPLLRRKTCCQCAVGSFKEGLAE